MIFKIIPEENQLRKAVAVIAGVFLGTAMNAMAETIFEIPASSGVTYRGANSGPGQGVTVSSTTAITDMAFDMNLPNGGDVEFMIWNGDNSTLLFSSELRGVAASTSQSWVYSDPFSFTLDAGLTYWFGVIANSSLTVGYRYPTVPYSANGLSAINTGNSNYIDFSDPQLARGGYAQIGLVLDVATTPTPEPSSIALLGMGLVSLAGIARRKFVR